MTSRRMQRRLPLTLQGDGWLSVGQVLWMDMEEMVLWVPQALPSGTEVAGRLELKRNDLTISINLVFGDIYENERRRARRGDVVCATFSVPHPAHQTALKECLLRVNPEACLQLDPPATCSLPDAQDPPADTAPPPRDAPNATEGTGTKSAADLHMKGGTAPRRSRRSPSPHPDVKPLVEAGSLFAAFPNVDALASGLGRREGRPVCHLPLVEGVAEGNRLFTVFQLPDDTFLQFQSHVQACHPDRFIIDLEGMGASERHHLSLLLSGRIIGR